MKSMEKLMQYVWQHRLWPSGEMATVDGRTVHVIDPGKLNTDAGPDFFNAKVRIGDEMWVGNVEIHYKASDWLRHHHDQDDAYDSVILHVVDKDDMPIRRRNGDIIPQLRMPCSPDFHQRYMHLVGSSHHELPCRDVITQIPDVHISTWITALAVERLYRKVDGINALLERYCGDWEEVCYITVARCLGFGVNSDVFERLAQSMPLRFMGKHSDSLLSIEALLFGQSGMLDNLDSADEYARSLRREYDFLANKFSLRRPDGMMWKMARMRPANSPHRRIAFLASLIHGGFGLMSQILSAQDEAQARLLFQSPMTGYWANHYSIGVPSSRVMEVLSQLSINILIINAVVPLVYAYGAKRGDEAMCERAMQMLQQLPAERNSVVDMFVNAGIKCRDALTSQAMVQLRREYCEAHKCLYCRIGHRMLAAKNVK